MYNTFVAIVSVTRINGITIMKMFGYTRFSFLISGKYQLAESVGAPDSPVHTPRTSMGSIAAGQLPSRAVSTSTLLSEVVSLVKIRPRGRWMKHTRLRESVDGEALEVALQNGKAHR